MNNASHMEEVYVAQSDETWLSPVTKSLIREARAICTEPITDEMAQALLKGAMHEWSRS